LILSECDTVGAKREGLGWSRCAE